MQAVRRIEHAYHCSSFTHPDSKFIHLHTLILGRIVTLPGFCFVF